MQTYSHAVCWLTTKRCNLFFKFIPSARNNYGRKNWKHRCIFVICDAIVGFHDRFTNCQNGIVTEWSHNAPLRPARAWQTRRRSLPLGVRWTARKSFASTGHRRKTALPSPRRRHAASDGRRWHRVSRWRWRGPSCAPAAACWRARRSTTGRRTTGRPAARSCPAATGGGSARCRDETSSHATERRRRRQPATGGAGRRHWRRRRAWRWSVRGRRVSAAGAYSTQSPAAPSRRTEPRCGRLKHGKTERL